LDLQPELLCCESQEQALISRGAGSEYPEEDAEYGRTV